MNADGHSAAQAAPAPPPRAPSAAPLSTIRSNLRAARLDRREIAGSLGDLGTFLPLLVGMSAKNGLDFAAGLFFAGFFSVVTGLLFAVPMAVQPMKAIAAVALTEGLTAPQIVAAGAIVSAVVLTLGLTGLIETLNRLIPRSLVRGLQLALGLSLAIKGVQMVAAANTPLGPDGYAVAIAAAAVVLALSNSHRLPPALLLFAAGVAVALWRAPDRAALTLWLPSLSPPAMADFAAAFLKAAVPQIPLTTLNSVVAVCVLSMDLFPDRPIGVRRVATSVGLMNLVGCWFGAMPMCHGAGGMAGQHRFGARTNGSILFLGVAKMALAVLFGASLMSACAAFPAGILGVMLAFSGLELALVARDQTGRAEAFITLATAGACLALNNMALGFAVGAAIIVWMRLIRRVTGGESSDA